MDPHITQYTVYITDNYTGDSIVEENVTETKYTFNIQDNNLCPMYQVSAWNAGGEGELSEPVQKSSPQGKQVTEGLFFSRFRPHRPIRSFQQLLTVALLPVIYHSSSQYSS